MTPFLHPILASSDTTVNWFSGWAFTGNFTLVDLVAASTNALNGALLARRPDHYKNFTIVGILGMALLEGLGGGITRDVLRRQTSRRAHQSRLHHARPRLRHHRLPPRVTPRGSSFARGCSSS